MGIWDYACSLTDSVKRNAPDLKPIKGLCSTSYAHGLSAAANVGNAVKASAGQIHTLKRYLPDQEAQHEIVRFTICLVKNAAFEFVKFVPGGDFALKIVTRSYEDVYKSKNDHDQEQVANKKALDGMQIQGRSRRKKLSSEEVVENYKASDDDDDNEENFKSQSAHTNYLTHYQKPSSKM